MAYRKPAPATALLLASAALLTVAMLGPSLPGSRPAYDFLFVVDISQSMLVRDQLDAGGNPLTRLDAARAALLQTLRDLPCGSSAGVGLFTGWETAVAFRPIEVCNHRSEIATTLSKMDWRMTWVPQSNIARGLRNTLAEVARWPATPAVVFITDGDEAPAVSADAQPRPAATRGHIAGVLAGVGATTPSPVPKYEITGKTKGFFEASGEPLTSRLQAGYLRNLAAATGLHYVRLAGAAEFSAAVRQPAYARALATQRNIAWVFAALALAALLTRYLLLPRLATLHPIHARRRSFLEAS